MATVLKIRPEVRAIQAPAPLRDLPGWLLWRFEQYEGESKPRKVPFYHSGTRRHGQQGSPQDRAQLTTFSVARDAAARRGFDGVGLALMPEWGVVALDFDRCVAEDGSLPPEIEQIVARTYAEYSPSGKGIRAFVRGDLGNHKSAFGPEGSWGLETFSSTGYVTLTGDILDDVDFIGHNNTIAETDAHIHKICMGRFNKNTTKQLNDDFMAGYEPILNLLVSDVQDALDVLDPDMGRDGWVVCGMGMHHQFSGDEEGFDLWNDWSSNGSKYPGEESLRSQWESFTRRQGPGRRQVTMASVLKMAREARADDTKRVATVAEAQARAEVLVADLPESKGAFTPAGFAGKFPVLSAAVMMAQKPIEWLIKGVVPAADLGMIFGQSGSGKSFAAFDMAAAIARGTDWRGHRARQGTVVIITAEGGGSYGKRIQAYCNFHKLDASALPIGIINAAPNILEADDIGELTASICVLGEVAAIIVDTLAQVTPGANENTSEDMGRALANAMVLRKATGAMVILIHHSGKDQARGARGWSGIKGALDVEIEVSRDEMTDAREIRLSKMKDEEDGLRFAFKLEIVTLGTDSDGDEYRSCVVVEDEVKLKHAAQSNLHNAGIKTRSEWQVAVIEAASTWTGQTSSRDQLIKATMAITIKAKKGPDRRRENINRAIDQLGREKDGPIGAKGDLIIFYS